MEQIEEPDSSYPRAGELDFLHLLRYGFPRDNAIIGRGMEFMEGSEHSFAFFYGNG